VRIDACQSSIVIEFKKKMVEWSCRPSCQSIGNGRSREWNHQSRTGKGLQETIKIIHGRKELH
jgi:hypothetical protein